MLPVHRKIEMKIKINKMESLALDWAVAKCEGDEFVVLDGKVFIPDCDGVDDPYHYRPSGSYNDGGPIIEREEISIWARGNEWAAESVVPNQQRLECVGPTPLIAAMRCYVASQLGDEVEVPDQLFFEESKNV